jgi:nucleotide-binding universal stress UspA family protein
MLATRPLGPGLGARGHYPLVPSPDDPVPMTQPRPSPPVRAEPSTNAAESVATFAIRTILLASDLSPASSSAEALAFDLAARLGASVLLVNVIDPRALWLPGGGYRERIDQARAAREAAAQAAVDRGRRRGVPIRCLIWEGDPGESIVEAAAAESVDLIVVGTHGRRGVDRFFVGSVSERVVRTAPVAVLVARPPIA